MTQVSFITQRIAIEIYSAFTIVDRIATRLLVLLDIHVNAGSRSQIHHPAEKQIVQTLYELVDSPSMLPASHPLQQLPSSPIYQQH